MFIEYPMSGVFLDNWADVEDIWEYMLYSELGIEEGNHPVLVTEVANTSRRDREKMAEVCCIAPLCGGEVCGPW